MGFPSPLVPGALSYSSVGTGSPHHFAGELLKATFRLVMTHVPYKGGAPALIDTPDYKQRQLEVAADIVGSSPEALGDFQKTEIEKDRKIAASAGITPE